MGKERNCSQKGGKTVGDRRRDRRLQEKGKGMEIAGERGSCRRGRMGGNL